jgi:hypothetical protein
MTDTKWILGLAVLIIAIVFFSSASEPIYEIINSEHASFSISKPMDSLQTITKVDSGQIEPGDTLSARYVFTCGGAGSIFDAGSVCSNAMMTIYYYKDGVQKGTIVTGFGDISQGSTKKLIKDFKAPSEGGQYTGLLETYCDGGQVYYKLNLGNIFYVATPSVPTPVCNPQMGYSFKCVGDWSQRDWILSDCSFVWQNYEYCPGECVKTTGQCPIVVHPIQTLPTPKPPAPVQTPPTPKPPAPVEPSDEVTGLCTDVYIDCNMIDGSTTLSEQCISGVLTPIIELNCPKCIDESQCMDGFACSNIFGYPCYTDITGTPGALSYYFINNSKCFKYTGYQTIEDLGFTKEYESESDCVDALKSDENGKTSVMEEYGLLTVLGAVVFFVFMLASRRKY